MSKLGMSVAGSLSPYPPLDPILDTHNSASLTQAHRQIKSLTEENIQLKSDLAEISSAYKQLITESSHENYDERRINFLKAQMIQLERQVLMLSEALSSRSNVLLEVENSMATITDLCKEYMSRMEKIGEVSITKDDLYRLIQTAQSSSHRLYKTIENTNSKRNMKAATIMDRFLKTSSQSPVTLLDICSGETKHINLKHVAKLESSLSQVYRELMLISQSLHSIVSDESQSANRERAMFESANSSKDTSIPENGVKKSAHKDLPRCVYSRLGGQVIRTSNLLKDVTQELSMLSILLPAAPWPVLKKPVLKEMTTDNVMCQVKGLGRSKMSEVRAIIDSLLKATNYQCQMKASQLQAVKEEVLFHQKVYHLQLEYTDSLWQAFRVGFQDFQTNTDNMICQPMKELLTCYDTLQVTTSEDALKLFLQTFKSHYPQLCIAVDKLSCHLTDNQGEEAISAYREDFFNQLNKLTEQQQHKRDTLLQNVDVAKQQHANYREEIQKMFPEEKYEETIMETRETMEKCKSGEENITSKKYVTSEENITKSLDSTPATVDSSPTATVDRTPRARHRDRVAISSLSPPWQIDNGPWDSGEVVDCNCGVDSSRRTATPRDTPDESSPRSDHTKVRTKGNKPQPVVANWKPSKPIKGVAQSKLILKPMIQTKCNKDDDTSELRHGSLSDVSQCHVDEMDSNHGNGYISRPRSGSLSRLGQGSPKPGHLQPLVGPKAGSSHPWR